MGGGRGRESLERGFGSLRIVLSPLPLAPLVPHSPALMALLVSSFWLISSGDSVHMILTVSSWQDGAKGHGPTKQRFTNTCRCVAPSVAVLLSCFVVRCIVCRSMD